MSASVLPPVQSSKQIEVLQKQLKQQCYHILQSNHQTLWQNFVVSILNHINFAFNSAKTSTKIEEIWIKEEIESILKWVSNPKNRDRQENYKIRQYRWLKQKKQWQATFARQLTHQQGIKQKYEQLLQKISKQNSKLVKQKQEISAKNSVLQSLLKTYQYKFSQDAQHAQIRQKKRNFYIVSMNSIEANKNGIKANSQREDYEKLDSSTMTTEFLPSLEENSNPVESKICFKSQQKQIQTQTPGNLSKNRCQGVCTTFSYEFRGLKPEKTSTQIQTERKQKLQFDKAVFNIFIEEQKQIVSKRQTNTSQHQEDNLDRSCSSSSSSSYILQCDRGTQTLIATMASSSCQTDSLCEKANKLEQAMLAQLLMKISHLQNEIQEKNEQINWKKNRIVQIESQLQINYRQVLELKSQLRVSAQIEQHVSEKYEQQKEKYKQLEQKYQEVLSILSNCIFQNSQHSISHQLTQTQNQQIKSHKELKSESQDDQPLTTQSEDLENSNPISMVDKSTIVRYLLEFIKSEIQGVNVEKRAAVLVTLMSVLEVKLEDETLLQQYLAKISSFSKAVNKQDRNNGLEEKLFRYLTQ